MVSEVNDINSLSPDGSGRFIITGNILDQLYKDNKKNVKMLDVGGGSPYISSMLNSLNSKYELTSLDLIPKPIGYTGNYVQSDATDMPFKADEFDVVISTDVLEHVPDDKKKAFVSECIRVAKDYVIIAAPFNTEGVDDVERATNDFNRHLFNEGQVWLEEHFDNKKPELNPTLDFIKKLGFKTEVIGSNNIFSWLFTTHTNLIEAKLGLGVDAIIKNNKIFNQNLLSSSDMLAPYYRHFIIISKSKEINIIGLREGEKVIDNSSAINYAHEIMTIISDRIEDVKLKSEESEKRYIDEIKKLNSQISDLKNELNEKDAVIESCSNYIKIRNSKPLSFVGRKKKDK